MPEGVTRRRTDCRPGHEPAARPSPERPERGMVGDQLRTVASGGQAPYDDRGRGGMAEWFKAAVLKTAGPAWARGFESLSLRHVASRES